MDLQRRVLAACDDGMGTAETAETFGVSEGWVRRLKRRRRATGEVAPRIPTRRGPAPALAAHDDRLLALVRERPGRTAGEYRGRLGAGVAAVTVRRAFRAAEQDRPGVADRRRAWRAAVVPGLRADKKVFMDETWAKTKMARTTGYAPRGQRLVEAVPHGHWQTTTFVAGLRASGWVAPLVIDGAVNGDLFRSYVGQHLAPALRPGDALILDNLGSHTVAGVREAVEAAGARLMYLPPHSPDLNPIELAFSKLKRLLRAAAERTVDGLWRRIGRRLDRFAPAECRRCLLRCGYTARRT